MAGHGQGSYLAIAEDLGSRYLAEQTGSLVTEPGSIAAAIAPLRAAGLLMIAQSGGLAVARMSSSLRAAVLAAASPALLHSASAAAADALTQAWTAGAPQSALARCAWGQRSLRHRPRLILPLTGNHRLGQRLVFYFHEIAGLTPYPARLMWEAQRPEAD